MALTPPHAQHLHVAVCSRHARADSPVDPLHDFYAHVAGLLADRSEADLWEEMLADPSDNIAQVIESAAHIPTCEVDSACTLGCSPAALWLIREFTGLYGLCRPFAGIERDIAGEYDTDTAALRALVGSTHASSNQLIYMQLRAFDGPCARTESHHVVVHTTPRGCCIYQAFEATYSLTSWVRDFAWSAYACGRALSRKELGKWLDAVDVVLHRAAPPGQRRFAWWKAFAAPGPVADHQCWRLNCHAYSC